MEVSGPHDVQAALPQGTNDGTH